MRIASPKAVRSRLLDYAQRPHDPISNGDRGAIIGAFEKVLKEAIGTIKETPQKRYLVWGFCFGEAGRPLTLMRSGSLYDGHFFALKKWISFRKDGDEWTQRHAFHYEVRQIFALADGIHFAEKASNSPEPMTTWLNTLNEMVIEREYDDMTSSAIGHMGGVVTGEMEDTPEYREAFEQPDTGRESDGFQPDEGYVPL